MKKSLTSVIAIVSLFAAAVAFAAETKEAPASKVAGCCAKAAKEGKAACDHPCCVEAAKAGDNCAKCGGSGKAEKKAEAKKE